MTKSKGYAALVSCACLAALSVPVAAQGQVHVVDDEGPLNCGSAWIFDLEADGALGAQFELDDRRAVSPEVLADNDAFGSALAALGDLNGDGTPDLAVGAPGDDGAGTDRGAVWVLFRAPDGSVLSPLALRPGLDFPAPSLGDGARFGSALASLGDLDGDGSLELAVGIGLQASAPGSVWVLSLEADGTVSGELEIGELLGGFGGDLDAGDHFGSALASLGDLDGDGVTDLAVGARGDDDGAANAGALWVLFLDSDATVSAEQKVSASAGGFLYPLDAADGFGSALAAIGDLDDSGVTELAVGTSGDDDGGSGSGAVWMLFLQSDGTVALVEKLSEVSGGLGSHPHTRFGASVAALGDRDSDGTPDLVVGAPSAAFDSGAVFVLFLNPDGTVHAKQRITTEFSGLAVGDELGAGLAALGDWDLDGRQEIVVGAPRREGLPPLGDFRHVQRAIDSALSGDTLLIRDGYYETGAELRIDARSLTLQAENRLGATLALGLRVENLAPSQSVRISGLVIEGDWDGGSASPLELVDNDGKVWIDDCRAETPSSLFTPQVGPGIRVSACDQVVLNRVEASGSFGTTAFYSTPAPAGLELAGGSFVAAYDCVFTGADGYDNLCGMPLGGCVQQGGAGVRCLASDDFLFLSGCTVEGGSGAYAAFYTSACSPGGHGLATAGQAKVLDSSLTGGPGGHNGTTQCAANGAAQAGSGTVEFLSGAHLELSVTTPTTEGEEAQFSFAGPPGAAVYVLFSFASGALYRPAQQGTDLLGSVRKLEFFGRTDGAGTLEASKDLGALPPGFEVVRLFAQSLYVLPSAANWTHKASPNPRTIQLGAGTMILLLDPSF